MRTSITLALLAMVATLATAQAQTPAVSAPTGQKTLAATMNVYVFPSSGQSATQQSKDESACYNWAVQNTGSDPFQIANQETQQQQQTAQQVQQADQAGKGTAVKGTVGGAAVGALIGGIAGGEAGKGAVWGAGLGLLGGAARAKHQEAEAAQQAQQQGQAASQALAGQLDNFKKAFSVCLEAKQYMVKY